MTATATATAGYVLEAAPRGLSTTLPQRRKRFSIWPTLQSPDGMRAVEGAMDDLFAEVGLDEYVGCSTYEFDRRPLLAIKAPESSKELISVCAKWFPLLMDRVRRDAKIPVVTLDKRSKIGSPIRKRVDNKYDTVEPFFQAFIRGDYSSVERDGFALQGIRLQWERRSKVRHYVCARKNLSLDDVAVDAAARALDEGRLCSRTRMIVNPAVLNLAKLPCDNSIHHVLLSWRCCKPDLSFMRTKGFHAEALLAPDWTHFDHQAGYMARMYAATIGGEYERACLLLWGKPVLCRTDGWRDVLYMSAAEGYLQQFWSGDSSVAPFGKFVCLAVTAEFIQRHYRLDDQSTLEALIYGEHRDFGFRNYGDDNVVFGSSHAVEAYRDFATSFIVMDFEDPPRFLGDVFTKHADGYWRSTLDWRSYFLNWYLPERPPGTLFRPYPCYGYVARKQDYAMFGPPQMQSLFEVEQRVLAAHRIDVSELLARAAQEAAKIKQLAAVNYRMRYDKAYMLDEETKSQLPEYNVVPREMVISLLKHFFPPTWRF
jgi:hypothetical protein